MIKRFITYALGVIVLAGAAGASLSQIPSPTVAFYVLQLVALGAGILHVWASRKLFAWASPAEPGNEWALAGFVFLLAEVTFMGCFWWLQKAAFTASFLFGFLPFLLPLLILYAYWAWMLIPAKIYRKWFYPVERPVPLIELNNTIRLNFMVTKKPDAPVSSRFTVTLPQNRTLDELFQYMIYSHNFEEDPDHPIQYHEDNTEGTVLGWIFYRESFGGWVKQFLDPAATLQHNGLKSNDVIIARSFTNN